MDRLTQASDLSDGRRMLLETLAGHLALLKHTFPRKASSATAKRAQQYVVKSLRETRRRAA